jgi:colanic acid/amylovoran biosynthesis protein
MRILVEPSDYILRNVGDMAMMQIAVERLNRLWPHASIQILSDTPDRLPAYAPNAQAMDSAGRQIWYRPGFLAGRLETYLPKWVVKRIWMFERILRRYWPSLVALILRRKLWWAGYGDKELNEFLTAVSESDLVIANGMGGITDAFPKYASELLDTMWLATRRGASTAMVGQGVGPLCDPDLWAQARSVLPRVDFISLREERASGLLLRDLGVPVDRVLTTGDDAIEMAYTQRLSAIGSGFGVNLRLSSYAEVDEQLVERLRPLLQTAARKYHAPMIPVPISGVPGEADAETICLLMQGYENQLVDCREEANTPLKVIKRIQRCRIVISGSYHAAVFALSMGIPAIGLASSTYYEDKFLGLADQFGPGCRVIFLRDPDLATKLSCAIDEAWQCAEQTRPGLLAAAARQVELSHMAYRKIYALVEARKRRPYDSLGKEDIQ